MKKSSMFLVVLLAAILVGCGTVREGQPEVVTQPVWGVDQSGQLVQLGTTTTTTPTEIWEPNTNLVTAATTIRAITAAGSSIPSPAQPVFTVIDYAVTGAIGLLGIFGLWKNKKLTTANAALAATTTVIETAQNAAELKAAAQKAAMANGSEDYLNDRVKNL